MKIVSVLLIVLLATGLSFSQSFLQLQNLGMSGGTDTIVVGVVGYSACAYAYVKNTSSSAMPNVHCKRRIISMVTGNLNQFCWGTECYGYGTIGDSSSNTYIVSIAAGATESTFDGYLVDGSNSLINDTVQYTVFDYNNPNDSVSWVVVYAFTTGINNIASGPKNTLVNAFPDPSDNAATIQYSLAKDARSAKINVMNMLGNKVGEYQLDTRDSKFIIPTNSLAPGIYFYSLEVDGTITATKKLVVNR